LKAGAGKRTIFHEPRYTTSAKQELLVLDHSKTRQINLDSVNRNNTGTAVKSGKPYSIVGKKIKTKKLTPVKALPMRTKDNATVHVQFLDVAQGLSVSYISAVLQDSKGNFWFGTDGMGVTKYDGVHFYNYTKKEGLVNNIVTSVTEDKQGNLWMGTHSGVSKFDGVYFTNYTTKEGLPADLILNIYADQADNLWFSTKGGGVVFFNGTSFTNYTRKEGLPSDSVTAVIQDKKGIIWIATLHGAVSYNGTSITIYNKTFFSEASTTSLFEDKNGVIWFAAENSIIKLHNNLVYKYTDRDWLSQKGICSFATDSSGNLWVSTSLTGLNKFDGQTFTQYSVEQGFSNNKIRQVFADKSGCLWMGSDGGGVIKYNPNGFAYLIPEKFVSSSRVRPILKDNNNQLWMGFEMGQLAKLQQTNTINTGNAFTYFDYIDNLNVAPRSIIQSSDKTLWLASNSGEGLINYNGSIVTKYKFAENLQDNTIFDVKQDDAGSLFFGTGSGRIGFLKEKIITWLTTTDELPAEIIYSVFKDRNGNLWFGTDGAGLCKYNGTSFTIYTEKDGLPINSVTSITEDKKGNLWLGTLGAGVCMFNGKSFTCYRQEQGLSNNFVWSVFVDSSDNIWAGTDKGLNLFTASSNQKNPYTIYSFDEQDGLKASDFNLHGVSTDGENRIWWSTGKNAPSLPANTKQNNLPPQSLTIQYLEINEQLHDFQNKDSTHNKNIRFADVAAFTQIPRELSLPYDQNHLKFHFSAIDWSAPHQLLYSYRLMGLQKDWSYPASLAFAEFRNLAHGNYTLEIRAVGRSQQWTKAVIYSFTIRPPWWLTSWFKLIAGLLVTAVLFYAIRFIYRYQLRKQKEELEKQLAVQFERQRISAEMHDDIGAGLSGIRLMTELVKSTSTDNKTNSEMEKIYQSVSDISARMKEVIWSLNTEHDHVEGLISYLHQQSKQMMEYYPGRFIVSLPETVPAATITGDARRHIYLAVKEALHNCIKHSGATEITLTIHCLEHLSITVADNGKGMNPNEPSYGNGIKNLTKRMKAVKGKLFITTTNGVSVTFNIPLKSSQ
ncbi:MAG: hypothetical protein KA160_05885, partial [Lacibacter sp.]|nr:hypothetical protein [Lacibacter sp.]